MSQARLTLIARQGLGNPEADTPPPLPRLKKIRFRQVRDPLEPGVAYGIDIILILPCLLSFSTLELWRDSLTTWNHAMAPPDLDAHTDEGPPVITWPRLNEDYHILPYLTIIRLFGSSADERQVTNLVLACPNLVELVVEFAGTYTIEDGVDAGNGTWDWAIQLWNEADADVETEVEDVSENGDAGSDPGFNGDDEVDEAGDVDNGGDADNAGMVEMGGDADDADDEEDIGTGDDTEDEWEGDVEDPVEGGGEPAPNAGVTNTEPPATPLSIAVKRAQALRTLSITGCGCASYLDRQKPTIGESKPLPSDNWLLPLPLLDGLDHLTIDLWGLFGNVPNFEVSDVDLFLERIPPFLTSLTLVRHWDIDQSDEGWPNRDALHTHELMIVASALTKLIQDKSRCLRELSSHGPSFDRIRRLRNLTLVHPRLPGLGPAGFRRRSRQPQGGFARGGRR